MMPLQLDITEILLLKVTNEVFRVDEVVVSKVHYYGNEQGNEMRD